MNQKKTMIMVQINNHKELENVLFFFIFNSVYASLYTSMYNNKVYQNIYFGNKVYDVYLLYMSVFFKI